MKQQKNERLDRDLAIAQIVRDSYVESSDEFYFDSLVRSKLRRLLFDSNASSMIDHTFDRKR